MQQPQQLAACKLSHKHNTARHWRRASLQGRLLAQALVQEPGSHKHKLLTTMQSWLFACSLLRSGLAVGAGLALTT